MAKTNFTPATKSPATSRDSKELRHPQIPAHPVLYFRGAAQSDAFTSGALRFRDWLLETHSAETPGIGTAYDELTLAEQLTDRILALLDEGAESRRGVAAAIAHWTVIDRSGADPEKWTPLAPGPVYVCDGTDTYNPPAKSTFFDLAGEPISLGPELVAYAWGSEQVTKTVSLDVLRLLGKPISAKRFETMRAQLAESD